MRIRQIRAVALSVLLTIALSALPATAAPSRDDDERQITPITKVIKKLAAFVVHALDTLTLPKP